MNLPSAMPFYTEEPEARRADFVEYHNTVMSEVPIKINGSEIISHFNYGKRIFREISVE